MARNMQPIAKRCKALGISPAVMGYAKKTTERNTKGQMRRKQSEYGLQLNEKQKVKFVYGVLEKQFRAYYEKAAAAEGVTGEVLLSTLELRLDNVVFRMGFALTRREARQLVSHGHFTVNGKVCDIPSFLIKAGDVVEVKERSRSSVKFKRFLGEDAIVVTTPTWIERDKENLKGTVTRLPERADIDFPVEEHLIVELYSK
ncbi:MAG: 30S ribosomal protein S4 [Eubacteriales bacterium]|nr:30S ribosomal protein S4 [Eubacteriales bacterium]